MLAPKNQADGLRNAAASSPGNFKNKKALRCIAIASGKGGRQDFCE